MEMHADDEFSKSFDFASGATAERFQNPLWPVTELFTGSRFRRSVAIVKDFGRRIVTSAVQDRAGQRLQGKKLNGSTDESNHLDQISGSLIRSLLEAIGNEEMVADAALTYLSAGRDTTGQALTWAFYLLMQHPEAVAKIRNEIQLLLSTNQGQDQDKSGLDPTLFIPASVPYTMAVFYETLRLYPPIPFEIRQCQEDTTLPDGTFLPKHSVLVWCLWAMQRSRETWGEDADEFRPERFLDFSSSSSPSEGESEDGNKERDSGAGDGPRLISRSAPEFPVFYGGARTCLGRKMAEAIAAQTIPTLLWLFDFKPAFEGERISKTSLTLPMEGGLPAIVTEIERSSNGGGYSPALGGR
jgi:cytochrome P450